jgi:hypothetical protein
MSEIIGWIGNVILIAGQYSVGNRARYAFLMIALGELIWVGASALKSSPSMMFICFVFALLSIRNFIKLDKDKKTI